MVLVPPGPLAALWHWACYLSKGHNHPFLAHSTGLLEKLTLGRKGLWKLLAASQFAKSQSRLLCISAESHVFRRPCSFPQDSKSFLFNLYLIKRPKCTSLRVCHSVPSLQRFTGGIFWRIKQFLPVFIFNTTPSKLLPSPSDGDPFLAMVPAFPPFPCPVLDHLSGSHSILCFWADPDLISLRGPSAKGMAHISIWGASLDEEKEPKAQREKKQSRGRARAWDPLMLIIYPIHIESKR